MEIIDIRFSFLSDCNGGDPDITSPTLRKYHKLLWNKRLPNGSLFHLSDAHKGSYLVHSSEIGEFHLGSDAITNSYGSQQRKMALLGRVPGAVMELVNAGSTIGAYILFPNKKMDGKYTVNQARGVNRYIDDRFDLTLECIRRYYSGERSPLEDAISRYRAFFDLFENFMGYVHFFLLEDLLDNEDRVLFFLPFDEFNTTARFNEVEEYIQFKDKAIEFINRRNQRILNDVNPVIFNSNPRTKT